MKLMISLLFICRKKKLKIGKFHVECIHNWYTTNIWEYINIYTLNFNAYTNLWKIHSLVMINYVTLHQWRSHLKFKSWSSFEERLLSCGNIAFILSVFIEHVESILTKEYCLAEFPAFIFLYVYIRVWLKVERKYSGIPLRTYWISLPVPFWTYYVDLVRRTVG